MWRLGRVVCTAPRRPRAPFTDDSKHTIGGRTLTEALTEISPIQWDLILDRISEGNCVPFLGAAVNVRSRDESYPYAGLPLADKVAFDLVKKLTGLEVEELEKLSEVKSHPLFDNSRRKDLLRLTLKNLARVALHVDVESNFDFKYLLSLLQKSLSVENTPSKLLETIACIETLNLIVTTNYDRLMENALEKIHRPYELVVQPIDGFTVSSQKKLRERLTQARTESRLILYKIHGTFPDAPPAKGDAALKAPTEPDAEEGGGEADTTAPQSSRIIITEDDYIKFLTVIGEKGAGVPTLIRADIISSTLLFLGYSLEDWDFRTIYKSLVETLSPDERPTSYAIQKDPPLFWVKYWQSKRVDIRDMDVYRFADELKKKCQEKGLYREEWGADAGGE
jgi:hypothetical protein